MTAKPDISLYKEKFFIAHFFAGPDGLSKIHGLSYFLIEAAAKHAEKRKLGYDDLSGNNLAWVLNRQNLKIFRIPRYTETILVETWIHETTSVYSIRDFHVYDESNNLILIARTSWMLIDLSIRKPVRIPEKFLDHIPRIYGKLSEDLSLEKLPTIININTKNRNYTVVYSDLDMNHHVNNVSYLRWVLDDFDFEYRMKYALSSVELNYRKEAFFKERILISTEPEDKGNNEFLTNLIDEKSKNIILSARTKWLKKK